MAADKEAFLDRWSRLKREERAAADEAQAPVAPPAAGAAESEAPPLPPMESLTPESDFSAFMHPKVPELMRRTALKKLFQDPRYNVVDKFEAYWQDFTQDEGISPELLKTLDQARRHVFGEQREERAPEIGQESAPASSPGDPAAAAPAPAEAPSTSAPQQQNDVPRTQDS
jgi:hypothetical protein